MPKRNYSNVAAPQTLSGAVSNTATTLTVGSTTGYPAVPFLLGLERGTANEEVVLCTATTATTFTVTRGYDGTTGKAHAAGSLVEHTVAAVDYRQGSIMEYTTTERDALAGNDIWVGRVIFNTTAAEFQGWDGTAWGPLGGGGATVQAADPGGTDGDLWWDTDEVPPSAFGDTQQSVVEVLGLIQQTDTRSTTNTYTSGKLTQVVEKDGATTVKTTTLTYTGENLTQVQEVAGGKTITTTLTYTGSDLTSTSRTVV